jgi:hypothetical protein
MNIQPGSDREDVRSKGAGSPPSILTLIKASKTPPMGGENLRNLEANRDHESSGGRLGDDAALLCKQPVPRAASHGSTAGKRPAASGRFKSSLFREPLCVRGFGIVHGFPCLFEDEASCWPILEKLKTHCSFLLDKTESGDPTGNRTRATSVKGRCPNR